MFISSQSFVAYFIYLHAMLIYQRLLRQICQSIAIRETRLGVRFMTD